jgi:hypothetical protein
MLDSATARSAADMRTFQLVADADRAIRDLAVLRAGVSAMTRTRGAARREQHEIALYSLSI